MTFGEAVNHIMNNERGKVKRRGWINAYIFVDGYAGYNPPNELSKLPIDKFIVMKTIQGSLQLGWFPTQADMFASDWDIVLDDR